MSISDAYLGKPLSSLGAFTKSMLAGDPPPLGKEAPRVPRCSVDVAGGQCIRASSHEGQHVNATGQERGWGETQVGEPFWTMKASPIASDGEQPPAAPPAPDAILSAMAETFRERNRVYGDNWKMVGAVMAILHPDGVTLKTAADHDLFHLWSLVIVKLTRFATSGLTHGDSIHDASVYGAMIESQLLARKEQT